jgi:hypothetical protein
VIGSATLQTRSTKVYNYCCCPASHLVSHASCRQAHILNRDIMSMRLTLTAIHLCSSESGNCFASIDCNPLSECQRTCIGRSYLYNRAGRSTGLRMANSNSNSESCYSRRSKTWPTHNDCGRRITDSILTGFLPAKTEVSLEMLARGIRKVPSIMPQGNSMLSRTLGYIYLRK